MIKSFNPYPGLRPYRYEESHLFFGRERHIAEIIRKLEQHRFVSIVGNSGSGKSSIVKAGVLPSLVKQDENWITATFRPGENPIFHLANDLFDQNIFKDKNFTKEDKRFALLYPKVRSYCSLLINLKNYLDSMPCRKMKKILN
jgi:ABC-type dipeptide/oligopeptide/nickel transport system ATPase component